MQTMICSYRTSKTRQWVHLALSEALTSKTVSETFALPFRESTQTYVSNLSHLGKSMVSALAQIPGVVEIKVGRYDMSICYGDIFAPRTMLTCCKKCAVDVITKCQMQPREKRQRKPKNKQLVA